MKLLITIPAILAMITAQVAAHSWLECVDTDVTNKAYQESHPSGTVVEKCNGYPRNKVHNGDWISESSYYAYGLSTEFACREGQRVPGQTATGAPMATATPGQTLDMRFWGNGHSRWDIGSPNHRDPGLVRIFWAGKPETEIVYAKDLNEKYWIPGAQGNFSTDAIIDISPNGKTMNEKANFYEFTLPEKIQNGRHSMVWAWAWKQSMVPGTSGDPNVFDTNWDNAWVTCFDIQITGSKFTDKVNTDILANSPNFNEGALESAKVQEICSKTCFEGGQESIPCTGANCPPCWYKNAGVVSCYGYREGTTCPFPSAFDCKKAAASTKATSSSAKSNKAVTPAKAATPAKPNKAAAPAKAAANTSSNGVCSKSCNKGGMAAYSCTGANCPPCRYANGAGVVDCYAYNAGTTTCPWAGASDCKSGVAKREDIVGHARKHRRNVQN